MVRYNWAPWYSVHARKKRTEAERERSREFLRKLWKEKHTLYWRSFEEREMAYLRERFGVEEEMPPNFEVTPELREEGDEGAKGSGYRQFNANLDYAMTREEVGRRLGISGMRVSQIEEKALQKIRHAFERLRPKAFSGRPEYPECAGEEAYLLCK